MRDILVRKTETRRDFSHYCFSIRSCLYTKGKVPAENRLKSRGGKQY